MKTKTPRCITCSAKAIIGDTEVFGSLCLTDGEIFFEGGRIRMKTQLKKPIKTLLKRLEKGKKCSITAISEHFKETWNNSSCDLINYSLSIGYSGHYKISFTLRERDDNE